MASTTTDTPATSVPRDANVRNVRERLARGEEPGTLEILGAMRELFAQDPQTMVPLLGLLRLAGRPYSLHNHFQFEPMYKVAIPKRTLWKCARQVAKSTNIAANGTLRPAATPLQILFVTPRHEQIRRFSNNYIRPFIRNTLLRSFIVDESCTQAVLQKSYINGSTLFFSFAFLDVDRVRGIACDWINYDEVADIDYDFLPIIHSCMDASQLSISTYSGTPKTLDNGIQALWEMSSQAEWAVPCNSCGKWNLASIQAELLKMIERKGVVCGHCKKPVNPRRGHWYHTQGKHHPDFHGYHIPQIIMPMHYESEDKWGELIDKMDGRGGWSKQKFMNEILGESADLGVKLVTITDIVNASRLGPNNYSEALDRIRKCRIRAMGVDWGGGGMDEISYTTVALTGLNDSTGKYECHYCERFHAGITHDEEARRLLLYFREAGCHWFGHDYGGSGSVRETLMIQAGLPIDRILGFCYSGRASAQRNIVVHHPPAIGEIRGYYMLDKPRSLVLEALCLKSGVVLLPEYESSKNVTHDFLALMEDKHDMPGGSDIYLIRRQPKLPDDFAHALNYSLFAIWHTEQRYPDLSFVQGLKLSEAQMTFANPPNPFSAM